MMNKDDKMVFFYRQGHETITVSISAQSSLTEAVEAFERFLKGAGYHFDERLDFVADEETLGSADEDEETPIVFGSNDWENSINLDLQNMGATGPTLTVSDDIDFSNINLHLSAGEVDQIPVLFPDNPISFTTEDLHKFHSEK